MMYSEKRVLHGLNWNLNVKDKVNTDETEYGFEAGLTNVVINIEKAS